MQRRLAQLPLHTGKAPPWLFKRMTRMAGLVTMAVVDAYGPLEMLRRLSDPWWFQAFGCVLGFDWHSSGVTTVTCGALKEAARQYGPDLGLCVAGGKGAASRKTPTEIAALADRHALTAGDRLIYASRLSAKVDSAAVQDGYQVYHHSFFFAPATSNVAWCVVQQGMNETTRWARRYHWLGESVHDFVCEPHAAIRDLAEAPRRAAGADDLPLLNMVASEAQANRDSSAALVRENPDALRRELESLTQGPTLFAPAHHQLRLTDANAARLQKIIRAAHERHPRDFETLLGTPLVGPATIRSLSLLAEIIHHAPASHRDPAQPRDPAAPPADERRWADYAYAHGGKDGTPFPVDRATYDRNLVVLEDAVRKARLGQSDKADALRRLAKMNP